MVLFSPGPMVGEARGSIGGQTFSRNRGGMYIRTRAVPTNTITPARTLARQVFANISSAWETVLTPAQRTAWDAWAEFAPEAESVNKLGNTIRIGGKAAYQRLNTRLLFAGMTPVTSPPTKDAPQAPALSGSTVQRSITNDFDLDVQTASIEATERLQLYAGPYVEPGATLLQKNQLRLIRTGAAGTNSVAGGDEWEERYGPVQAGQRIAVAYRVLDADGLTSDRVELGLIEITQEV
jgi:hypothetical protein